MIRSLYYTPDGKIRTALTAEEFKQALQDPNALLWVDFEATAPREDEPILLDIFGFHPLAVDDALQETHIPKIDDWGDYLYIVLQAIAFEEHQQEHLNTLELDVFLGENYLVTHHDEKIHSLDRVWDVVQRDLRHIKRGPDHLLYRLIDELVGSYIPVLDEIDDVIDKIEDEIFIEAGAATLEQLFTLKRDVLHLRRIINPEREVLNKLARDTYRVVDSEARLYFRDVYDHLVRMQDITESMRDLISGTMDTYLSVVNNRMNDVMKILTIITTLFMPITFVSGFFGMNFFAAAEPLVAWTERPIFYFTLAIMLATPVAMYFWMRRRGWM